MSQKRIAVSEVGDGTQGLVIVVPASLRKDFETLIFRGANLWPDAIPAIKEFADLVTVGVVLQNYAAQDTSDTKGKTK